VDPIPTANTLIAITIAPKDEPSVTIEKLVPPSISGSMILR
jgi:hypothetical protein